ncbi:hypothetical protein Syun_028439 [Stephania yunnanensis]|uniref:Uncharacterized protein n=1 Tax=Stephania yunnanensis TaxID=152371 RepID=A0AAP0EMZ9_9MAGN
MNSSTRNSVNEGGGGGGGGVPRGLQEGGVVSEHWHHRVYLRVVVVLASNESYQGSRECLLVMLLENHHSLNMKRTPMKFIQISSMPVDENIALKKNLKLKVKLPQPKSQVENITLKKKLKLKFANNGGGTCGHDSSLQDPNNNNTNPKCESATSKRLGNPAAAYPKGVECLKTCEGQLSPSKSLRAAMLKSRLQTQFSKHEKTLSIGERVDPLKVKLWGEERFEKKQARRAIVAKQVTARCNVKESLCETRFLKHNEKTLSTGERVDPLKVKQEERERFEKKQREEKARIDAHVKVAKEEVALKLLRQKQVARLALEEMEKSVDVYDSFAIMKDLEMMGVAKCIGHDRVMEGLGLYLKNEFTEDGVDVEEGEIIYLVPCAASAIAKRRQNLTSNGSYYLGFSYNANLRLISHIKVHRRFASSKPLTRPYSDSAICNLRRLGLLCENKDDGEIASEIHIFTSSCFKSNVIGKFANTTGGTCGHDSSLKDLKNNNTNPKCESATSKRLGNPAAAYPKGSFGDMKSRCSYDNAFSEASSGVECLKTCEGQLSPSKSLHAAILKSRFADTILKAQQKTLCTGERVDLLKVKQEERERFEKKQREENARIDAHIKAAKKEATLKLLRQRQAARLALEEMEKSVDVYDSFAIMKDLEMMGVAKCIGHDRVLEGLGLYLKKEFPEDDDDVEEGEIICVECLKACEGQLSSSKSLRAAMLKIRFADTILKAQQKTLSTSERVDPLKVKQEERERFEKKQREEKAKIDAYVKAAKEEAALKLLRQRQAARLALVEMEKSAYVYDGFAIMKDLEMMGVAKCIGHDRVLEGFGLYLKNEFPEEDDDDVEEGEIICFRDYSWESCSSLSKRCRMSKTCEGQLSPSKSSHAAMSMSRFADTILKAQQKTLSTGGRVDPLKVKQEERERFEKKQREEKARIDAHVKAAKEEVALKLLRQKQAARLALEEMEKSVDVYDSFAIMKDLEMMGVAKCIGHDRVMEDLGLYFKNEFPEDDVDVEEGEIIC